MGLEPQEKKERNGQIMKDYQAGMNFVELVSKYKITSQRIWQIIQKEKEKAS